MSPTTLTAQPPVTTESERVITIAQIVGGDAKCHCGADAVLVVDTEPDNEPGPTCFAHADEWIGLTVGMIGKLFGPNNERTK